MTAISFVKSAATHRPIEPSHHAVRLAQPFAVFRQRRVRNLHQPCPQRGVQVHQPAGHAGLLRPRCHRPCPGTVLPSLDHVGDAHLEPAGSLPSRQLIRRKNPIPQILRIRLTATPRHDTLRHQPDTYESHPPASLKHLCPIPPSTELL